MNKKTPPKRPVLTDEDLTYLQVAVQLRAEAAEDEVDCEHSKAWAKKWRQLLRKLEKIARTPAA